MQATLSASTPPTPGTYWQWRQQSIYYVRAGKPQPQRPPLLLVHGFGASTDHWRKNIAQLQEDFEVWAIDLLGFGRSAKPNEWEWMERIDERQPCYPLSSLTSAGQSR